MDCAELVSKVGVRARDAPDAPSSAAGTSLGTGANQISFDSFHYDDILPPSVLFALLDASTVDILAETLLASLRLYMICK